MPTADTTRIRPRIHLDHIHVSGLRGLRRITLPQDGLGWSDGQVPDLVVLAGPNGSGKTTLLRCLTHAARVLVSPTAGIPNEVAADECLIDFSIGDGNTPSETVRFLVGDEAYIEANGTENCFGYVRTGKRPRSIQRGVVVELRKTLRVPERFAASHWPRVVFFPSDDRDLVVPAVKYKAPGQLADTAGFVETWERLGPKQWSGSTLELLFSARWSDLNAKEEGQPEEATSFERFTRAFNDLTGARKQLAWTTKGELVVEVGDGVTHPVQELSAGERQVLLLLAELRRLWRPGSLIMIDELELHLHDRWQARLLDVLRGMLQELGGQVIVTTQSHSLFEMAGLGTRALLGREGLR